MRDIIYYDITDGKVINSEIYESFAFRDFSKFNHRVGIMGIDQAKIVNGYITNYPGKMSKDDAYEQLKYDIETEKILKIVQEHSDEARIRRYQEALEPVKKVAKKTSQESVKHFSPIQANIESLNKARQKSHTQKKQSSKRDRLKKIFIAIFIIGVLAGSIITHSTSVMVQDQKDYYALANANSAIVSMVTGKEAGERSSIVSINTHSTYDKDGYWYDNYGIAEMLAKVPDEYFDTALYGVYENMGPERSNNYINNWDDVLNHLESIIDLETHPISYAKIFGCNNFESFLQRNGYVDKNGNPSVDEFIKQGKKSVAKDSTSLSREQNKEDGYGTRGN